jgi:hypothetical protein
VCVRRGEVVNEITPRPPAPPAPSLSKEASFHKLLPTTSPEPLLLRRYFVFDSALHFGMTVPYVPSASDLSRLETYKEYILAWMRSNPGTL